MTLLARSYAYCERLARREAGNFYHAFRMLPRPQARSMCALYAFLRITDDISDGPGTPETKQMRLSQWRKRLNQALAGQYDHRLHAAFHDTVRAHSIPSVYFEAVINGVESDLQPVAFLRFADLYQYCYRVASVVGLACIHIWGFSGGNEAKLYAESAGIGFQLTNILRDLGEDAGRGRIYLPREDLDRFGYTPEQLRQGTRDEHFRALMRFEVDRARGYYAASLPLAPFLSSPGRAVFQVMTMTYRSLLDAIERRNYDVFSRRVSLSALRKWKLVLQALPVRWGWT
jgi:15-cis-phytoene synthase